MAEEQRPGGHLISKAIGFERPSRGEVDLKNLKDTLVKSSLWKANTFRKIEDGESGQDLQDRDIGPGKDAVLRSLKRSLLQLVDRHWQEIAASADSTSGGQSDHQESAPVVDDGEMSRREARKLNEYQGMRKALAVQVKEVIKARRRLRQQELTLRQRSEEIDRLQQTVSELQRENTSLTTRHREELDGQQNRLLELQQAYDQFQQQSDQLLTELDQENARLRAGETDTDVESGFT